MEIVNKDALDGERTLLRMIWHNSKYDLSVSRAFVEIPYVANSLFIPETTRIDATWRVNRFFGKKVVGYDYKRTFYLPCRLSGSYLETPLDDADLLKIISLNRWTKAKDVEKGQMDSNIYFESADTPQGTKTSKSRAKEYPLSLIVTTEDYSAEFLFSMENNLTPALLCEPFLNCVADKKELIIAL